MIVYVAYCYVNIICIEQNRKAIMQKEENMNKLGIFMNFWENNWGADHIKYIKKASDIGFDILEFQAQPLLGMTNARMDEIRNTAAEYGIELTYSLGLDKKYDISSTDENIRSGGIKYLTEIMNRVHYMGGKIISGVSYAGWGVPSGDFCKEKLRENSIKSMKTLMKTAENFDITYAVEAVNRFEGVVINTAKEALDYVTEVGSKKIGILLDTYHMNIEENNIGDAILLADNRLVGFHTGENNRTAPGRAHLDWNEIFSSLAKINYTGRIVSEPFVISGGEVGRDIYVWRNLVDDTSEKSIDDEARFLLNFEKKMLNKYFGGER